VQEKDGRLFAIKSQESRRIEFARNRKKISMTYMTRPRIVVWTVRARDRGQKMNKYSSELTGFSVKSKQQNIALL
jgi:hypothetical protein